MKQIFGASKTVLSNKVYLFGFLALIPLIFFLFVLIPVKTIPGNDLMFQLSIFSTRDYILTTFLSILLSLFLAMQIFIFRGSANVKSRVSTLGSGGTSGFVAVVGSVFATAACSSCLFALFGFLGFNTLIFLLERQWYIVGGAIVLLLISLYFTSRKIDGICEVCDVNIKK